MSEASIAEPMRRLPQMSRTAQCGADIAVDRAQGGPCAF